MKWVDFEYPWLLLLWIPYLLILFYCWRRKEPSLTVPSIRPFQMASEQKKNYYVWRKAISFLCFAIAGGCLVTALARPRTGLELIRSRADGIDIILAVDLSGSMEAMDIPGHISNANLERMLQRDQLKTRLEISKEEIAKFVEMRPNDRIGLIAFADRPYVICPPTLDHAFLLANLFRMRTSVIGDGTGIAGPVASAVNRLKDSDAKSRIVVLFTDGENTVPQQITPLEAAKIANSFKITLYTVGIGSRRAVYAAETPMGKRYMPYEGQFDEALLRKMSEVTGGVYYHAADAKGMRAAMKEIDKLEKTSAEQPVLMRWKEYYDILALLAAILMVAGAFLKNTFSFRYP